MDISIGIDQLIMELKEKTSSHQDFNKILEFYEMNEYGLAFEWICADFIENDLPVSETGKINLMNIFNHLNVESEKEWAELVLENKLKALQVSL